MSSDASAPAEAPEEWPRAMAQPSSVQPGSRPARPLVDVSDGGTRCTFTGESGCVTVLAEQAVPRSASLFYFEMTVLSAGEEGKLAIGLAPERIKHSLPPGFMRHSYGYHGQDGGVYSGADRSPLLSHSGYTTGDVVGAGVHYKDRKCIIFFTKNGQKVPCTLADSWRNRGNFMPAVCLASKGEAVQVNFGTEPFVFRQEAEAREEQAEWRQAARGIAVEQSHLQRLVRDYLVTNAHVDTLAHFEAATRPTLAGPAEVRPVSGGEHHHGAARKAACRAVRNGDAAGAAAIVDEAFPGLLDAPFGSPARVHLRCQAFIELVRGGDVEGALAYGQQHLRPLREQPLRAQERQLLRDAPALLAYEDLHACPVAALAEQGQRDAVARVVNGTMLLHSRQLARGRSSAAASAASQDAAEAGPNADESAAPAVTSNVKWQSVPDLEACGSRLRGAMEQLEAVFAELQRHNGGYGEAVTAPGELERPVEAQ